MNKELQRFLGRSSLKITTGVVSLLMLACEQGTKRFTYPPYQTWVHPNKPVQKGASKGEYLIEGKHKREELAQRVTEKELEEAWGYGTIKRKIPEGKRIRGELVQSPYYREERLIDVSGFMPGST